MKKAVSLMMAAAMTMGLAACGSTASTDTAASAADTASSTEAAASTADSTAAADGKVYNIGICQLVQHEALDAATQGFKDAKSVGLLYCSAEPNSVYQCDVIEGYLNEEGYTVARYAFTDTNDVTSVAQTAADNSDVIYIPTDNTAASNTEAIANVVIPAKVPVVAGEEGICSGCGVATLSISYYDLGYATGEMAAKILADRADVSAMPVEFAPNVTKKYNAANCEALGITPPSDYVAIG